tara:strand:- start:687 stop:1280 length:594 start_codon:yes stop_codon:yes gene_type:complete
MAKKASDLIMRDRLQFTLDASGDLDVVYGRIDLSDYVNTVQKKGLAVKEVRFMVRDPSTPNTGSFRRTLTTPTAGENPSAAFLKVFATTTAYENAQDVGLASPSVFSICEHQEYRNIIEEGTNNVGGNVIQEFVEYGTPDLHPDGYTVVTDILIGVAANDCTLYADETLEVDIMLIAEPITVTQKELNEMLVQAQDL